MSKQIRTTNPKQNRSERYQNKFRQPTQHKTDLQDIKTNSENQPNTKQICKISKQIRTTNPTRNRSSRYRNKFGQPTQHKTDLQDIKTNSDNQPNTKQICKISNPAYCALFHLLRQDEAEQPSNVKKSSLFYTTALRMTPGGQNVLPY